MSKREREYIKCKNCGKKVEKRRYQMKFCGTDCRNNFHNQEKARLMELGRKIDSAIKS